jgi:hypothetical protein
MAVRKILLSVALALSSSQAAAQDGNGPIILSERLQELALEYPVAERLSINWDQPDSDATGRYIGFLAATNVIADEIAERAGRDDCTSAPARLQFPGGETPVMLRRAPASI